MGKSGIACMLGRVDKMKRKQAGRNKGRCTTAHIFWSFVVYQKQNSFITIDERFIPSGGGDYGISGGGGSDGGRMPTVEYTGSSPPCVTWRRRLQWLGAAIFLVVMLAFQQCKEETPAGGDPKTPDPQIENVKFSIGSVAQLRAELPKMTAAAADKNKFVEVELTANIGFSKDDLNLLDEFSKIAFDESRFKINWNGKFIYPLQKGILISYAEWIAWGQPPIGANPNNEYKFRVTEEERAKFGVYAAALEIHENKPPLETVSFTIANVAELEAKIDLITATAEDDEKYAAVTVTGNVLIAEEHRDMLAAIGEFIAAEKATMVWGSWCVAPSVPDMKLTFTEWESWGYPPLGKNGDNVFLVAEHQKELFGDYAAMVEVDPDGIKLETISFTITNAAELQSKFAAIKAAIEDEEKFAAIEIKGALLVNAENMEMLKAIAAGVALNKANTVWDAWRIAPAVADMKLSFAEWEDMGYPPLGKNGDIAFQVAESELALFGEYSEMLEIDQSDIEIETVTFNITDAADLAAKISQIYATANDPTKFAQVNITNNLGINDADKANLKTLKSLKSGDIDVNWNGKYIYPAQKGVTLTYADWLDMDSPAIGVSPTGDKFEVTENDLTDFPTAYKGMLTTPEQNPTTLDISISNLSELSSKTDAAIGAAMAGTKVTVDLPGGLTLNNPNMIYFARLDHANITFTTNSWIRAGEKNVPLAASLANKVKLFSEGVEFPENMFKISGNYRDYTGNIRVGVDTLTHSTADLGRYVPTTIIFKFHGKDVSDLTKLKDFPGVIECQIVDKSGMGWPGNRPAWGNANSEVIAMTQTPGTNKPAGDFVLLFTQHPVITTYTQRTSGSQTMGEGGIPANPIVFDTNAGDKAGIGDSIGTNWGWQILRQSNALAGSNLRPHVKGDANNEIRLVPIRATEYRAYAGGDGVPGRTYFDTRAGPTYNKVSPDLSRYENGLKIIINGEDVVLFLSSGDASSIASNCQGVGGTCRDDKLKSLVLASVNMVLRGSNFDTTTSIAVGRKIR